MDAATTRPAFNEQDFRKAMRSQPQGNCVRVARLDGWVEVRDDKTTFGAADDHRLVFTREEFDVYLTGEREGQAEGMALEIIRREDGMYVFRRRGGAIELVFTEAEVIAFQDGVAKREFDTIAYTA